MMTAAAAASAAALATESSSSAEAAQPATAPDSVMDSVVVSILIVNWRSKDYVRECLKSIARDPHASRYEVIVVDNASFDGCGEMLAAEFPETHYVQSEVNLGFARANNLAFSQSTGRQILYLNPDTEISEVAIQRLSDALDRMPEAGMVGARLLNSDGSLQTTCITALPSILNQTLNLEYLRRRFPAWSIWGMRALYRQSTEPARVEAISGACMMARREVVERVGGFSTHYFMYSEDMDLCVKVAEAGGKIYYVPEAVIVHHGGGSSSKHEESDFSSVVLRESVIRYLELHRGRGYAAAFRLATALSCVCRLLLLAVASPLALSPRMARSLGRTARKWWNIFGWSLGMSQSQGSRRPVETAAGTP